MEIQELGVDDIHPLLLRHFNRYQEVTQCWRKCGDNWLLENCNYIRDWDTDKKQWAVSYFVQCLQEGGALLGAFDNEKLIGFALIGGGLSGRTGQYANLEMLMVSHGCRHKSIGSSLFYRACQKAAKLGAEKLFISAHTAADVVAFYQKMECREAEEIIPAFVDTQEDLPMEFPLKETKKEADT